MSRTGVSVCLCGCVSVCVRLCERVYERLCVCICGCVCGIRDWLSEQNMTSSKGVGMGVLNNFVSVDRLLEYFE